MRITKAELARQLQVTRGRISQLAKFGMPVRADGLVDREMALHFIQQYCSSIAGGWAHRGKKQDISDRARDLLRS